MKTLFLYTFEGCLRKLYKLESLVLIFEVNVLWFDALYEKMLKL